MLDPFESNFLSLRDVFLLVLLLILVTVGAVILVIFSVVCVSYIMER